MGSSLGGTKALGQSEEHDFFAGAVLMSWCRLNTLTPVISWTIASMTGRAVSISWVRTCLSRSRPFSAGSDLDQLLFGRGQDALEADHEEIADQVGVNVLGAAAHVFLLEAADPFADGGFDFSLRLHANLEGTFIPLGIDPSERRATGITRTALEGIDDPLAFSASSSRMNVLKPMQILIG